MDTFTLGIWSTFAWTEKFNNGLCTYFSQLHGLKSSCNISPITNLRCDHKTCVRLVYIKAKVKTTSLPEGFIKDPNLMFSLSRDKNRRRIALGFAFTRCKWTLTRNNYQWFGDSVLLTHLHKTVKFVIALLYVFSCWSKTFVKYDNVTFVVNASIPTNTLCSQSF